MSSICVRAFGFMLVAQRQRSEQRGIIIRSIYQDVPLYTLEEFERLAPEEARTEGVLNDEHQLMLNRLSFELAERQRYAKIYALILSSLLICCRC